MAVVVAYANQLGSARDGKWEFSDAQAITTDAISTNVVDLGATRVDSDNPIDLGTGKPLRFYIDVVVAFAGGTSMNFQLQTAEDAALASATTLVETGVIVDAKLTLGARLEVIMPGGVKLDRYIGFNLVDVGAHSAGSVDIYLAP